MKLLDCSSDQSADILCAIAAHVDNIVKDKELAGVIGERITDKEASQAELGLDMIQRVTGTIPILFAKEAHRKDVFGIIAAVQMKSTAEVAKQSLRDTISQFKEMLADEELVGFFPWLGRLAKTV